MKGTNEIINKKITAAFIKKIKQDPNLYFEDALKVVKNSSGKDRDFYLMKNKICFYYNVYDIAPYVGRRPEAYIAYSTKDTFKIDL